MVLGIGVVLADRTIRVIDYWKVIRFYLLGVTGLNI
jgi:hypothetical protein